MNIYIHREASFKRALDSLSRGDKKASNAAERAEEIMTRLASGDSQTLELQTRRTRHGELRIDGCRKYDLGGGYRLVCIKHEGHLVATFVGNHDDCDRWIENNRGFEKTAALQESPFLPAENHAVHDTRSENKESEPDYDDILMAELDQRTLRRIFTGISGEF